MAASQENEDDSVIVGSGRNFWTWSCTNGWDLTHPSEPGTTPVQSSLHLECEISNITIDPDKTALIIIDMQNYSVCDALIPYPLPGTGDIEQTLLRYAIPAARKANIQIIWLNWGLTEEDLAFMPPGPLRTFGWQANYESVDYGIAHGTSRVQGGLHSCGEKRSRLALGADLGDITHRGRIVPAGRALMRGTWNAALHEPLLAAFQDGQKGGSRDDVLLHKNRNSGLWSDKHGCAKFLQERGIHTLLFTSLNIDQCVMATLMDAQARGYDTILLRDGCATDSPHYAQQSAEFNCCRNLGFLSSCRALAKAVGIDNSM